MERVSAGPNWTSFEAPDVIFLFLQGEMALEDAETINRANQTFAKGLPYFFYLINMGGSATLSADVRKSVASALKDLPLSGTAIFNADFKTRVVAKLLLRLSTGIVPIVRSRITQARKQPAPGLKRGDGSC